MARSAAQLAGVRAYRARVKLEGEVEFDYLRAHIQEWMRKNPQLVMTALHAGINEMWWATRQEMHKQLTTRSGQLQAALDKQVFMHPDGMVDAEVFMRPGAGDLQAVKMRALELGSYREHPGGIPYYFFGGKPRFLTKEEAERREREGQHILRTKGPYGIRVGRHPVFKTVARKYRRKIAQQILHEIIEGFKAEVAKT